MLESKVIYGFLKNNCHMDSPGNVPDAGVDDDNIRFQAASKVVQDCLHVAWIYFS